ncbi:hypothetical protein EVAR_47634_1 [Eumeta japonica]|uniref:Uncharacterized protein n=1 Tax=Eumeta variegata TaxID=151549 RepID=A0A4C1ZBJ9_EUMVA|nr:hypothetical protein EVAR_47634_1 [Eumeta japonica]
MFDGCAIQDALISTHVEKSDNLLIKVGTSTESHGKYGESSHLSNIEFVVTLRRLRRERAPVALPVLSLYGNCRRGRVRPSEKVSRLRPVALARAPRRHLHISLNHKANENVARRETRVTAEIDRYRLPVSEKLLVG